jgi:hypothetical protein
MSFDRMSVGVAFFPLSIKDITVAVDAGEGPGGRRGGGGGGGNMDKLK